MNALVSIDRILSPETVAAPSDILTPAIVFAPGGVEAIISKLEAEVRATARDMTTEPGREAIKSLAYKVARSKTALDEMGKELVADIKKQSGAIDAERRTIRDRLDALHDEVRAPLTAWEDAEASRVNGHESALAAIVGYAFLTADTPIEAIRSRIAYTAALARGDWQEFAERAAAAVADTEPKLAEALAAALRREADAAELAELRKLKADRDAADMAAAEVKLEAERVRIFNENRDRLAAEWTERAARDARAAAAKAVEDERLRVAAVAAAAKAVSDKLAANKKHRAKIRAEISNALTMEGGLQEDQVNWLFEAIAAGKIPHVSITY